MVLRAVHAPSCHRPPSNRSQPSPAACRYASLFKRVAHSRANLPSDSASASTAFVPALSALASVASISASESSDCSAALRNALRSKFPAFAAMNAPRLSVSFRAPTGASSTAAGPCVSLVLGFGSFAKFGARHSSKNLANPSATCAGSHKITNPAGPRMSPLAPSSAHFRFPVPRDDARYQMCAPPSRWVFGVVTGSAGLSA